MKVSRRQFIKGGSASLLGVLIVYRLPALIAHTAGPASAPAGTPTDYDPAAHDWAFIVDTRRCIGCGRCVVACNRENGLPQEGEFVRTWVERYVFASDGEVYVDSPDAGRHGFADWGNDERYAGLEVKKSFFVPKLCNQCERPPCVQVCPVAATYKTPDGVILVNRHRCIGCRYCIQACPYGARYLHPEERVADKCTWCYHRITSGGRPACVEVCPVGARVFGDLRNPDSEVSRLVEQERLDVLKPDLGTVPRVRYIGIDEGVR